MHLFAPAGGPHAAETYGYLRRAWFACRDEFGMRHPIPALDLPRDPPERHRPEPGAIDEFLAAQAHAGEGVFQALLRRAHDVLCLSIMLAPSPATSPSWVELQRRWVRACGPIPGGLLGAAEIYQARLADPETSHVEPAHPLAAACRELLPAPTPPVWFDNLGVATPQGFAVWEAERDEEARARRRIVVLAPNDRDDELSAWTWSRGDAAITPFARYLMHAAKLRYHLRVWAGGDPLRTVRDRTDQLTESVAGLLDEQLAAGGALPRQDEGRTRTGDLRAQALHLALSMTRVREIRHSVEIAGYNLAQYAPPADAHGGNGGGLFADDRDLASWFPQQLDDDLRYADASAERAQSALDAAERVLDPPPAHRGIAEPDSGRPLPEPPAQARGEPGPAAVPAPRGLTPPRLPGPARVLALADEWLPGRGGLSALNRSLCAALAEAGAEVYCVVPGATPEERSDADRVAVRLVDAPALPGAALRDLLMRRPPLPDGVLPDLVLGHGRITGSHAKAVTEDHFPAARRVHIVHTSPDETDWWRPDRGEDTGAVAETRTADQVALSRDAAVVVAVGPRLHQWISRELSVFDDAPTPLRLDPGFDYTDQAPRRPPPGVPQVLMLGRLEDASTKGLDLAARAVGHAAALRAPADPPIELLLRGAPQGQARVIREQVLAWAGRPGLAVTVRNYSPDTERLGQDLRRASLVLMPSRAEGFGLVGLEAIVAGTPVLVSDHSGIGDLLREVLPPSEADRLVVPVGNDERDAEEWGRRVHDALRDRPAAFSRAESVRRAMREHRTWATAVTRLLTAFELSRPAGDDR
ncbi:glycosyl transferase family 1 [Pseudofrankia sp. EUN1h]|nr:glycosyl transferase family 1 [Pseudofrankia sp. EUN1h]